jgi:hypothetical protein
MEKNNDKKSNGKYKFLLFLMFTKIGFFMLHDIKFINV